MSIEEAGGVTIRPRIPSIVRRGCAVLLGLLILTPFTAPFSSFPSAFLFVHHDGPTASPLSGITLSESIQDEAPPSDAFSVQVEEKLKDDAVVHALTTSLAWIVVVRAHERTVIGQAPVPSFAPLVLRV